MGLCLLCVEVEAGGTPGPGKNTSDENQLFPGSEWYGGERRVEPEKKQKHS